MDGQWSGIIMLPGSSTWSNRRAAWGGEAAKLKLQGVLVWHRVMAHTDSSQASTATSQLASSHQPHQNSIRVSPDPPQSQTQQT